jgi:DNA end-binding protein Ku
LRGVIGCTHFPSGCFALHDAVLHVLVPNAQLIEKKSGTFDPKKFEDHYGTALKELVQEKLKGHRVVAKETERPTGGNVVDLMEALKRSIEGAAPSKKTARGGKKRA